MLNIYDELGKNLLAIPFVKGIKTNKEKFAGAIETYSIEALMHDGKALQSGTTHYFGDGFANKFDVHFQDKDGKVKSPHQTSWGVSTRLIGSVIMVHGDDNGLVLPPYVAPTQVVIIPIQQQVDGVLSTANKIKDELIELGLRVKLDDSDHTPGWKFAEYEMKGIPVRIEIGPRDLANGKLVVAKRNTGEKISMGIEEVKGNIDTLLKQIHEEMYQKAVEHLNENITEVHSLEELKKVVDKGGYAKMMWCEDQACEDKIKEFTNATARCIPFIQEPFDEVCPICGKKAKKVVYFAKAY